MGVEEGVHELWGDEENSEVEDEDELKGRRHEETTRTTGRGRSYEAGNAEHSHSQVNPDTESS